MIWDWVKIWWYSRTEKHTWHSAQPWPDCGDPACSRNRQQSIRHVLLCDHVCVCQCVCFGLCVCMPEREKQRKWMSKTVWCVTCMVHAKAAFKLMKFFVIVCVCICVCISVCMCVCVHWCLCRGPCVYALVEHSNSVAVICRLNTGRAVIAGHRPNTNIQHTTKCTSTQ